MDTDDLIKSLTSDVPAVAPGAMHRRMCLFLAGGAAASLLALLLWLGLRPDLGDALTTSPFWIKFLFTAVIGAAGVTLALRLARPGGTVGPRGWMLVFAPVLVVALAGAVQVLASAPSDQLALLMGRSWRDCPVRVVTLSVPLLVAAMLAMRRFAPTRPARAGLAAGLASGGLAATIYGFYCQETSIAFLAIWYVLGMVLVGGLGALAGARLLRW